MHTQYLRTALAGFAFCAASTAVLAADPAAPDMRGTWKVEVASIVSGAGKHHPADAPQPAEGMKPRMREFEATLRITGQEGVRFWGTLASRAYTEDFIATLTGEGARFVAVDSDGSYSGDVFAPGRARICYQQVDPALRVAGCGTLTRE